MTTLKTGCEGPKIVTPPAALTKCAPELPIINLDCGCEIVKREGEVYYEIEEQNTTKYMCKDCYKAHMNFILDEEGEVYAKKIKAED